VLLPWALASQKLFGDVFPESGRATRFLSEAYAPHDHPILGAESFDAGPPPLFLLENAVRSVLQLGTSPVLQIYTRGFERLLQPVRLDSLRSLYTTAGVLAVLVGLWALLLVRRRDRAWLPRDFRFLLVYSLLLLAAYSFVVFGQIFYSRYYYPIFFFSILLSAFAFDVLLGLARNPRIVPSPAVSWSGSMRWCSRTCARTAFRTATTVFCTSWIGSPTHAADARIGVFNSGAIGYFSDRHILNLDGKVNPAAFAALRAGRLPEYVEAQRLDYVIDHEWIVGRFLPGTTPGSSLHLTRVDGERSLGVPGWSAYRVERSLAENRRGRRFGGHPPASLTIPATDPAMARVSRRAARGTCVAVGTRLGHGCLWRHAVQARLGNSRCGRTPSHRGGRRRLRLALPVHASAGAPPSFSDPRALRGLECLAGGDAAGADSILGAALAAQPRALAPAPRAHQGRVVADPRRTRCERQARAGHARRFRDLATRCGAAFAARTARRGGGVHARRSALHARPARCLAWQHLVDATAPPERCDAPRGRAPRLSGSARTAGLARRLSLLRGPAAALAAASGAHRPSARRPHCRLRDLRAAAAQPGVQQIEATFFLLEVLHHMEAENCEALDLALRAHARYPQHLGFTLQLAEILVDWQRPDLARALLEPEGAADSSVQLQRDFLALRVDADSGRPGRALATLAGIDPAALARVSWIAPWATVYRGLCLARLGDPAAARAWLERGVEAPDLAGSRGAARAGLACLEGGNEPLRARAESTLVWGRDPEAAFARLAPADGAGSDPTARAELAWTRGRAALASGDFAAAAAAFVVVQRDARGDDARLVTGARIGALQALAWAGQVDTARALAARLEPELGEWGTNRQLALAIAEILDPSPPRLAFSEPVTSGTTFELADTGFLAMALVLRTARGVETLPMVWRRGMWSVAVPLPPGVYAYRFRAGATLEFLDPAAPVQETPAGAWSVRQVVSSAS
jgi:hypothetical protein